MVKLKWKLTGTYLGLAGFALFLTGVGVNVAEKEQLAHNLLAILFTALLLTLILAYVFAGNFSRRIEELTEGTKSLVTGLNVPRDLPGAGDELDQLGSNIYLVAQKFQSTIREVSQESNKMIAILSSMLEGVVALDHVGRIVLLNQSAAAMFGKVEEEVMGKYLTDLLRDKELEEQVHRVLNLGLSLRYELEFKGRMLGVLMSPVSAVQVVQGAVLMFQDVTEVRRLEQVRTEFVANVSHELRTPLTSIKGFAETLLDGAAANPDVRQRFLQIIHAETERLQRLIEDLLTLSYLENRPRNPAAPASVAGAYRRIEEVLTSLSRAKNISLEVQIPEKLPEVQIGEELLSQIFLNLMENSIKYTPSGGDVWLEVSADQDRVILIKVGDTGPGIPAESLSRIFERFYRVDKARSREMGGTGLGLSIVKHIVEQADGELQVQSEVGKGTLFTVSLPAVTPHTAKDD